MENDDVDSSKKEESAYAFSKRIAIKERDKVAEAIARKALVAELLQRRPEPKVVTRPGSVIQLRKKAEHVLPGNSSKPKTRDLEQKREEMPQISLQKKKRTVADKKLQALAEVAVEFGNPRNLATITLLKRAAEKLKVTVSAMKSHWGRYMSQSQKDLLLYGETGRKITRSEQKFGILTRIRNQMKDDGECAPTKRELAAAAAPSLGMTIASTEAYIYDRLTKSQSDSLDFNVWLTRTEQFAILLKMRKDLTDKGLPAPTQYELAKSAAPILRQKVSSVRVTIGRLGHAEQARLRLHKNGTLNGYEPVDTQRAFLAAVEVLRFRRKPVNAKTLAKLLLLSNPVVEMYLKKTP